MKVEHKWAERRVRTTKDVTFASGEVIRAGATGVVKWAEIALSLVLIVQVDGAAGGIFHGARAFTEDQIELIEDHDDSEPWCSACEGSESPAAFHTYDGGCDRRFDP